MEEIKYLDREICLFYLFKEVFMNVNISKYQIITIIWIILIFTFSSQPAKDSNRLSRGTTKDIAKIIEIKNIKNEKIKIV